MKKKLGFITTWVLIIGLTLLFLAFCNWGFNPKDWNGFSRFILATEAVIFVVALLDEYRYI